MNAIAFVLSCSLLAQAGESDRYKAKVVPGRRAPATRIEREPAGAAAEVDRANDNAAGEQPQGPEDETQPPPHRATHVQPHAQQREPAAGMSPVEEGSRQKLRPPELLAQALARPREGAIVGKPITLEAALARAPDRQLQLRIAQAYWRLSTAEAEYHWALDQRDKLALFTENHANVAGVHSARASARADVRDAQTAVAQAQQDLADLMTAPADDSLPLAIDRPHVGDYRTLYDSLFTGRAPPPRLRLIHRTLPVRRKAIDAHGEAILATVDALESTGEDFEKSGHGLATVLATLDQLKLERRAFMSAVRDYNQDIAEYAFTIAQPGASEKTLVAMLIKTRAAQPARGGRPAAPRAEPAGDVEPQQRDEAAEPEERTSNYQRKRPAVHTPAAKAATEDGPIYEGLVQLTPAERVQKLSSLLHWDRALPTDSGQPMSLGDCLKPLSPEQRLAAITAYWRSRERVARHQAMCDKLDALTALQTIAFAARNEPGVAGASVRVEAARLAAQAAVFDAHVTILGSEYDLMQATGRRLDDEWLLPSTPPHAGRYNIAADRVPRGANGDPLHWSKIVAMQHAKLEERGDAVIQADQGRALLVAEARAPAPDQPPPHADPKHPATTYDEPMPLDQAVRGISRQASETLAFLHDLTGYNLAIAHYALATWPTQSSDQLVKMLVLTRAAKGDG